MKFFDMLEFAIENLSHRGLRSWLTILGIVIGVAAVVGILSIGSGMQQTISKQLGGLGSDVGYILPGYARAARTQMSSITMSRLSSSGITLTDRDLHTVELTPGVSVVNGVVTGRVNIQLMLENVSVQAYGVDPLAAKEITNSVVDVEEGRFLMPGDTNAVLLGNDVANKMFKKPIVVNAQIKINGKPFKVVGIMEKSGGAVGGMLYDSSIFIPTSTARDLFTNIGSNEYSVIQFKVNDIERIDEITNEVERRLMLSRHLTNETRDFTIITAKSMQETVSNVMNSLNLFLGGIAAISLLVGAIGIANTMYMSVMERTRQIGTLKVLGATNSEIMKMFLVEASLIGLVGGLLGIFLGFIASGTISMLGMTIMVGAREASITVITPELILFALVFSIVIGALSGLLPARKAAQLEPVEALRYE